MAESGRRERLGSRLAGDRRRQKADAIAGAQTPGGGSELVVDQYVTAPSEIPVWTGPSAVAIEDGFEFEAIVGGTYSIELLLSLYIESAGGTFNSGWQVSAALGISEERPGAEENGTGWQSVSDRLTTGQDEQLAALTVKAAATLEEGDLVIPIYTALLGADVSSDFSTKQARLIVTGPFSGLAHTAPAP